MSALSSTTIGAGVAVDPGPSARLCVRALIKVGKLSRASSLSIGRLKIIPPIERSSAPIIAPMNTQRALPDIMPAPLRTNGESEPVSVEVLSCASIELISRSGGLWFGPYCIQAGRESEGPPRFKATNFKQLWQAEAGAACSLFFPRENPFPA